MSYSNPKLDEISFAQKQRLAFIDFSLMFKGHLSRSDLVDKFEMGLSAASRDFNLYRQFAEKNIEYDNQAKRYFQTRIFKPLFHHDARRTLIKLANQISDGFDAIGQNTMPVEQPSYLNVPDINVIARLVQGILNQCTVNIIYTSLSSGSNARDIIPHSIVDNGLRWHVRGYDRKSNGFRDFVLTRISKASLKEDPIYEHELKIVDWNWQNTVELKIIPHPKNLKHSTAIEMDYGMVDGVLELKVRAALAGYLLRRWNVDCTKGATLTSAEYQLYLQNASALSGAENLAIAPGYGQ